MIQYLAVHPGRSEDSGDLGTGTNKGKVSVLGHVKETVLRNPTLHIISFKIIPAYAYELFMLGDLQKEVRKAALRAVKGGTPGCGNEKQRANFSFCFIHLYSI